MKIYHHKVYIKHTGTWDERVYNVKIDTNIHDDFHVHYCYAESEIEPPACELDWERLMADMLREDLAAKKADVKRLQEELGDEW